MPCYQRQAVLMETLATYRTHYGDDVEIVVVDDGSPNPLGEIDGVKVIRLPKKSVGYSPVIPINIGVEYASHDVIAISLPEVRHETPVLYRMRELLTDNAYVQAPCYCESMKRYLSGPDKLEVRKNSRPPNVGFNFCVMFNRKLWNEVGGMTRDYRWGSHYDDTDFAWKIYSSGAEPLWVEDVVKHTRKDGAKSPWVTGGHSRNYQIFKKKW